MDVIKKIKRTWTKWYINYIRAFVLQIHGFLCEAQTCIIRKRLDCPTNIRRFCDSKDIISIIPYYILFVLRYFYRELQSTGSLVYSDITLYWNSFFMMPYLANYFFILRSYNLIIDVFCLLRNKSLLNVKIDNEILFQSIVSFFKWIPKV